MDFEQSLALQLEKTLGGAESHHWLEILTEAGVPCGPIQHLGQVFDDPQIRARNMLVPLAESAESEAGFKGFKVAGNPIKLSAADDPDRRPLAPALDADRAALLAELGLSDDPRSR